MKKDMTTQLIDYLDDRLTGAEKEALEAELQRSPSLRSELKALREVLEDLDSVPEEHPGPELSKRFYQFLEDASAEGSSSAAEPGTVFSIFRLRRMEWSVAAAIALLIIGVGFGVLWQRNLRQQQQIDTLVSEIETTRKMMVLSMLEEPSASQRIKALNTVQRERTGVDHQIIDALINTLNTDDNVNVRVKAAEALLEFTHEPGVIAALTRSLQMQEHPEVQITLIDVLTASRAKGAVDEFQRILDKKEVLEVVKNKAAAGIEQLM